MSGYPFACLQSSEKPNFFHLGIETQSWYHSFFAVSNVPLPSNKIFVPVSVKSFVTSWFFSWKRFYSPFYWPYFEFNTLFWFLDWRNPFFLLWKQPIWKPFFVFFDHHPRETSKVRHFFRFQDFYIFNMFSGRSVVFDLFINLINTTFSSFFQKSSNTAYGTVTFCLLWVFIQTIFLLRWFVSPNSVWWPKRRD